MKAAGLNLFLVADEPPDKRRIVIGEALVTLTLRGITAASQAELTLFSPSDVPVVVLGKRPIPFRQPNANVLGLSAPNLCDDPVDDSAALEIQTDLVLGAFDWFAIGQHLFVTVTFLTSSVVRLNFQDLTPGGPFLTLKGALYDNRVDRIGEAQERCQSGSLIYWRGPDNTVYRAVVRDYVFPNRIGKDIALAVDCICWTQASFSSDGRLILGSWRPSTTYKKPQRVGYASVKSSPEELFAARAGTSP